MTVKMELLEMDGGHAKGKRKILISSRVAAVRFMNIYFSFKNNSFLGGFNKELSFFYSHLRHDFSL